MQRTIIGRIGDFPYLRAEHHTVILINCEIMRIEELVDVGGKRNTVVERAQLSLCKRLDMAGLS
jgi:hypothetical protein